MKTFCRINVLTLVNTQEIKSYTFLRLDTEMNYALNIHYGLVVADDGFLILSLTMSAPNYLVPSSLKCLWANSAMEYGWGSG